MLWALALALIPTSNLTSNILTNMIKISPVFFYPISAFPTLASCLGQEQSMLNVLGNPHIPKF